MAAFQISGCITPSDLKRKICVFVCVEFLYVHMCAYLCVFAAMRACMCGVNGLTSITLHLYIKARLLTCTPSLMVWLVQMEDLLRRSSPPEHWITGGPAHLACVWGLGLWSPVPMLSQQVLTQWASPAPPPHLTVVINNTPRWLRNSKAANLFIRSSYNNQWQ